MDHRSIQTQLKQFHAAISKVLNVNRIILFGSYVTGKATTKSDIDVIVVSDDFTTIREDKRDVILDNAAEGIVPPIQAWGYTPQELHKAGELSTVGDAARRGVVLFSGVLPDFRCGT